MSHDVLAVECPLPECAAPVDTRCGDQPYTTAAVDWWGDGAHFPRRMVAYGAQSPAEALEAYRRHPDVVKALDA